MIDGTFWAGKKELARSDDCSDEAGENGVVSKDGHFSSGFSEKGDLGH